MREKPKDMLANIEQQINKVVFSGMLVGRFPREWSHETYRNYLHERGMELRLFVVRFGTISSPESLRQTITHVIRRRFPGVCVKVYDTFLVCLFFEEIEQVTNYAQELTTLLRNLLCSEDVMCYSDTHIRHTEQLVLAYQALLKTADTAQRFSGKHRDSAVLAMYALEEELYERIINGDLDTMEDLLTSICEVVVANHHLFLTDEEDVLACTRNYFAFLWRQVSRVVYNRTGKRKTLRICIMLDMEINRSTNYKELVALMMKFVTQMVEELNLNRTDEFHQIIEMVKEYVRDNCKDDVSLNNVAEKVGLSSFYLSKLFKKESGANFKDFVIAVRMEKAMQLLREGHMNVNEVATSVGYSNANYFSTAFHRYFGVTAKECMTRYR